MNVLDLAIMVIIMLAAAIVVLAALAWQEHDAAKRQRRHAEQMAEWAHDAYAEADAYRKRLHTLERRYATLQALHADSVRSLLARNYYVIEQHVQRRRDAR